MKFSLELIEKSTGGKTKSSPHNSFKSYSADNRDPEIKDSLFIPLVGDIHDAHKFVPQAVEAGATGVLFHSWDDSWESLLEKATFIEVPDTLKALQDFASAWRDGLSAKVIGLTGSNGKTTTKDFLSQILGEFGKVNASRGSYNNHWGVPFTLLEADRDNDFCIVEMGMNHVGELIELTKISKPDFVTVTNVGRAHMGNFSNGIQGVADAKAEIYQASPVGASFIFNVDNEWTRKMYAKYVDHPSYTFSTTNFSADVYLKVKSETPLGYLIEGQIGGMIGTAELRFWGEHNVQNLAAAVCLAYVAGAQPEKLWKSIEKCNTGWGRNQWVELKSGGQVLFDGYNANPDSFAQLLFNLENTWDEGKKYSAIFGEMLELGDQAAKAHEELGMLAGRMEWESCIFVGPSGLDFLRGWQSTVNDKKPIILDTYEESLDLKWPFVLNSELQLIVKGSRGGQLERFIHRMDPINFFAK